MTIDDSARALWREAFALSDRLAQLDEAARTAELERLGREQPGLHAQLLKLLAQDASQAQGPVTRRLADIMDQVQAGAAALQAGTVLGAYTLERPLGQGGIGEVWLARRTDGRYSAQVAVKMLHQHLGRPETRERFVREGQIAARLSHPNIARLYDAGATAEGLPYLVFEYVEGERIDRWCDDRRLDIAARVRLFLDVCAAVTHAHTHLIVHRDLKPSNIMVTADGQVKLLDFGIAKLLEADTLSGAETELTRLGGRALTPAFAAPEQLLGGAVTTVTDVYALGVMLYLLLSGVRPHGGATLSPAQLERDILETDPRPLATAATTPAAPAGPENTETSTPLRRAELRGTTPAKLRKALGGDLENIVRKALKKNPAERYPSVLALAEDLRRHLNYEPVLARPDALGYRLARLVRRNRTAAAAAMLVLLAIVLGVAGVIWQARLARTQALRAERVKDFVVSVFREQDPLTRSGKDAVTPQQMVKVAISRADEELRGDRALHAELLSDLGEIDFNLGEVAGSQETLRRALKEQEADFGPNSPQIVETLRRLSLALVKTDNEQAAALDRRALEILRQRGETGTVGAARLKLALATALSTAQGASAESLALHTEADRIFEAQLGPDDPETINALFELGYTYESTEHDADAEKLLREVIARYEKVYGPNTTRLAAPLNILARVLSRNDHAPEAVELLQRSIALTRPVLGPRHSTLASELSNLGIIYMVDLGRFDQAEKAFTESQAALPEGDDRSLANALKDIGRLHIYMGRPDEAEKELHRSFDLMQQHDGAKTAFTWYVASQWGRALADQGKLAQAEAIQREAMDKLGAIMGRDAYNNCMTEEVLGDTLEKKGPDRKGPNLDELLALRRSVLARTEKAHPKIDGLWARRASDLARARMYEGTEAGNAEAQALLDKAMDYYRVGADPGDRVGEVLLIRGELYASTGRPELAIADLREALPLLQHQFIADPPAVAKAQQLLNKLGG